MSGDLMTRLFEIHTVIRLRKSLEAWGSASFDDVLKQEIEQLNGGQLPLQAGMSTGSYALDTQFSVMINSVAEQADVIRVHAGIFYSGVIAGCSCADDPTPVEPHSEYCEIQLDISKQTAETTITLLV